MKLTMLAPRATLSLPDGTQVEVERIGKGRYTTAWRNCSSVYLQTHEKDSGKEIVCRLAEFSRNPHIPDCKRLDGDDNQIHNWYRMPLYKPLTAKSGRAWEDFKFLRQVREESRRSLGYNTKRTDDEEAYMLNDSFRQYVDDSTYLSDSIKEAVDQLLNECSNFGAYTIEITKKNCAVDADGNLILLDAVFDLAEIRAAWRELWHPGEIGQS